MKNMLLHQFITQHEDDAMELQMMGSVINEAVLACKRSVEAREHEAREAVLACKRADEAREHEVREKARHAKAAATRASNRATRALLAPKVPKTLSEMWEKFEELELRPPDMTPCKWHPSYDCFGHLCKLAKLKLVTTEAELKQLPHNLTDRKVLVSMSDVAAAYGPVSANTLCGNALTELRRVKDQETLDGLFNALKPVCSFAAEGGIV